MPWTGLKVVRKPPFGNYKINLHNSVTVSVGNTLHTITSEELYDQLLQCRNDDQRTAVITAWRLIHDKT